MSTACASSGPVSGPSQKMPGTKWRSPAQERLYGQKLVQAIRSARGTGAGAGASEPAKPSPSRAIKDAADSALALTARGQTRWSRAILSRQLRKRRLLLKLGGKIRRPPGWRSRRRPGKPAAPSAAVAPVLRKNGERVRERLRVLSRLVPGCRKLPTPTLLEEAADYVAALQMQVRAMRALADGLSAAAIGQS